MKCKNKELIITIIKIIVGSFISGYVLVYMPFGLMKFILTALIILLTFFVIDLIYKVLRNIFKN